MRTARIVSELSASARRNGTSSATILSTLSTPLANKHIQQEPYFDTMQGVSLESLKITMPTVNTDIRNLENLPQYASENNPNPPAATGRHSPTRITSHRKFPFDFRTFQERERSAQAKASTPTRSAQLRA